MTPREHLEFVAGLTREVCASGACAVGRYGCCHREFCEATPACATHVCNRLALDKLDVRWTPDALERVQDSLSALEQDPLTMRLFEAFGNPRVSLPVAGSWHEDD